jgi:protein subunit release factor A
MTDDTTFKPLSSPVGSLMAKIEQRMLAQKSLEAADKAIEARNATGNVQHMVHAARHLQTYERVAEQRQLGE